MPQATTEGIAEPGDLFQNRYTSVVCEEDAYFMELIRYIHLNPLRARVVKSLEELDNYPWSGHYSLIHRNSFAWYDADYVLKYFGTVKAYRAFMREGIEKRRIPDLEGGGLIRSLGGLTETVQNRPAPVLADERILGTDDFVKRLLEQEKRYSFPEERRKRITSLIEHHCREAGILPEALRGGNRAGNVSSLRSKLAFALARELGIPYAEIGRQLGITKKAPLRSILHGVRSMSEAGFLPERRNRVSVRSGEDYSWQSSGSALPPLIVPPSPPVRLGKQRSDLHGAAWVASPEIHRPAWAVSRL